MTLSDFRLGIVQDGPVAFDGTNYWNHRPMGQYLKSLSQVFGKIDIYAPVIFKNNPAFHCWNEFKLDQRWACVHTLSVGGGNPVKAIMRQMITFPFLYQGFKKNDFVLFFLPATFAFPGIFARRLQKLPYAIYFGNDWDEIYPYSFRWSGVIASSLYPIYKKMGQVLHTLALGRASFALTAGESLRRKVSSKGVPAFLSVPRMDLKKGDIYYRKNTCLSKEVILLFVGSLTPRKGLDCLIDGFTYLYRNNFSVRLHIVGDGELKTYLEKEIMARELSHKIELLGYVPYGPRLWKIYRDSDIFILPTRAEGFPRVLYEAMSQSLPIVTTDVSGIPYLMKHGENSLLIPTNDVNALVNAVCKLIKDSELRKRLINRGLKTVSSVLNKDAGKQLKNLIESNKKRTAPQN